MIDDDQYLKDCEGLSDDMDTLTKWMAFFLRIICFPLGIYWVWRKILSTCGELVEAKDFQMEDEDGKS